MPCNDRVQENMTIRRSNLTKCTIYGSTDAILINLPGVKPDGVEEKQDGRT